MLLLYMQSHIFLNGIKQMKPNQKRVYLCILRTYIFVRVVLCYQHPQSINHYYEILSIFRILLLSRYHIKLKNTYSCIGTFLLRKLFVMNHFVHKNVLQV